jgi:hypothetical protein
MKIGLTILLFAAINLSALPKDSVRVYQRYEAMFSNHYIFYENGDFKHFFVTDDGQVWYGKGIYKDFMFRRTLIFKQADSSYRTTMKIHYEVNFERKLRIKGKKFKSRDYYGTSRKRFVWFDRIRLCN